MRDHARLLAVAGTPTLDLAGVVCARTRRRAALAGSRARSPRAPSTCSLCSAVGVERARRLHRGQRQNLKQVIRDHVAQCASLLVIAAAHLDAERFGHRDLHVIDVTTIPDRLEDAVAEAEDQDVLDGLLAEVVINAIRSAPPA